MTFRHSDFFSVILKSFLSMTEKKTKSENTLKDIITFLCCGKLCVNKVFVIRRFISLLNLFLHIRVCQDKICTKVKHNDVS